jgi:hypothetical protein
MSVSVNGESFEVDEDGRLDLSGQDIHGISEIEGLEALGNLQSLDLSTNKISKIEGLVALGNLRELNLMSNEITKIEGLESLGNLQELFLAENQITKIEGLEALGNLQGLILDFNQVAKLEGLHALGNLRQLSLNNNQITKLEGLDALGNLQVLSLANVQLLGIDDHYNHITKLEGLGALSNLETLLIHGNPIAWPVRFSENSNPQEIVDYCKTQTNPCQACENEVAVHTCPDCGRKVGDKCWDSQHGRCQECQAPVETAAAAEEQQRTEEEEQRRVMAAAIAANPCEVCGQEVATRACKDVHHAEPLKVGDACWDEEYATCVPCRRREDAKRAALAGASAPEPEITPVAPASVPDMLAKVRRLLASTISLAVPLRVAAKAAGCADADEFAAWWGDLAIPGFDMDFDANLLRAESEVSLGALDALIAALRGPEA